MKRLVIAVLCATWGIALAGIGGLSSLGHWGGKLGAGVGCSGAPLSCPLVQSSSGTFTFLGSFKAPTAFEYGGGALSVNGTTLYMSSLITTGSDGNQSGIGSMTIPTLSGAPAYDGSNGTASVVVSPTTHLDGSNNPLVDWGGGVNTGGIPNGNILTGSLVYGGSLYITGGISYDASSQSSKWIMSAATNLANANFGTPNGASTTNSTYGRFFAGPMGVVPSAWVPYLGGPAYVVSGPAGLAISYIPSSPPGFMFSTFDPATVSGGGGNVSVTELLDYYWQGQVMQPEPQQLGARSYIGPYGSGSSFTLASAPTAGATSVTLASGFTASYPAEQPAGAVIQHWQVCFSDSECRDFDATANGTATRLPASGSFAALTCSPSCTTAVTIKPYGDQWLSEYDGPMGYAFISPGSKSLLYISSHSYGPLANRFQSDGSTGTSPCDPFGGASSNNDAPFSPDTNVYRQLQVSAYDLTNLYNAKQGTQAVYTASPYATWAFPGASNLLVSAVAGQSKGCIALSGNGSFFFDPGTDILYGTIYASYGSGNNIVYEWQVNSL